MDRHSRRPDPNTERRAPSLREIPTYWKQFRQLYQDDYRFRAGMSPSQLRSYLLLESWWEAEHCDARLPGAVTRVLYVLDGRNRNLFNPSGLPSERPGIGSPDQSLANQSLYHARCLDLFVYEFRRELYLSEDWLWGLQGLRFTVGGLSVLQKMARAALHPRTHPRTHPSTKYPVVLRNEFPGAAGRVVADTPAHLPYYLWDTDEKRTVEVAELRATKQHEHLDYVCVSHTWGRWRTGKYAAVPGVPWPVPENSQYDVRTLPAQLQSLDSRYVWFDLFCIPQNRDNPLSRTEIGKQSSIFRASERCVAWIHDVDSWEPLRTSLHWAALHFLHVSSIWRADKVDRSVLKKAAADTMRFSELLTSSNFLKDTGGSRMNPGTTPSMSGNDEDHPSPDKLSSWFSSLWTLQECLLCPDLELYSRGWERLEDGRGSPISIRTLAVFAEEIQLFLTMEHPIDTPFDDAKEWFKHREHTPAAWPVSIYHRAGSHVSPGLKELIYLLSKTRLHYLITAGSHAMVLTASTLRKCTSNRAPAIMSAIGVTDWYNAGLSANSSGRPGAEEAAFEMFPLPFLREAARKIGALFYDGIYHDPLRRVSHLPGLRGDPIFYPFHLDEIKAGRYRLGSMLPVSTGAVWATPSVMVSRQDHPAVATWEINEDGSVSMHQVGVFYVDKGENGWGAMMARGDSWNWDTPRMDITSSELIDQRRYAVALYTSGGDIYGVELMKLAADPDSDVVYLVKVGPFIINLKGSSLPGSLNVNWRVI
ncbi:hypothetical protein QBC39DRAFT_155903 [Podospora conica]|nr:hypothetical protein QBC39DRAFT_155903 [Schizothecium conicum]